MKNLLTDSELSAFAEQLAMILHSGISTVEGVLIMRDDTPPGPGKDILDEVYQSLEETGDLSEALQKTEVFPEYFIRMTQIAERSGTLEDVMTSLSAYYSRQSMLMRSIRDALTYPLILLTMLFAVLIVLMTQVMPVFREVFNQLGIEMTGISATVFRISGAVQRVSAVLLVAVVLLVIASLVMLRTGKGAPALISAVTSLPLGRRIMRLLTTSRFCKALALSLHSGLDMGESFELANSLTKHDDFEKSVKQASDLMDQGNDLSSALRDAGIITGLNARMVTIGFRTGTAEIALDQISDNCQEEADVRIQSAVNMLEPALTAILSVLTGLILVSVMLPLLGVMANIG